MLACPVTNVRPAIETLSQKRGAGGSRVHMQHLADAAAAFDALRGACDTQLGEGTTLTARAVCGCGHSPTSSPRSLGRAAAPKYTSVFCHTAIRMRVIPYVAQFLSKIN